MLTLQFFLQTRRRGELELAAEKGIKKCRRCIFLLRARGRGVLLGSVNFERVREHTSKQIWIQNGSRAHVGG